MVLKLTESGPSFPPPPQVGNTPGVTRGVQEVVLDKSIRLLDSPGIIFSAEDDAAAALRNAVKVSEAGGRMLWHKLVCMSAS